MRHPRLLVGLCLMGCAPSTPPPLPPVAAPPVAAPPALPISPHFPTTGPAAEALRLRLRARTQPPTPTTERALGLFLLNAHEHWAAREVLTPLARARPKDEHLQLSLGVIHMRLGQLKAARDIFAALARALPRSALAQWGLGVVASRRQDLPAAERYFSQALERDPKIPLPQHDLGVTRFKLGHAEAALQPLGRALALMPDHPCVRFDLMSALDSLGRTAEADAMRAGYWRQRLGAADMAALVPQTNFEVGAAEVGALRFTEVAASLGVDNPGRGRASAVADYDGDGDLDLLTGNLGERSILYRNDGATWTDASDEAGLGWIDNGYGHTFGDFDNDGDPDLYVTRAGFQSGRMGRAANLLFRNDGGHFVDITEAAGVGDLGMGFASYWADLDADGRLDLYVVNQHTANRLFHNEGDGTFRDLTDAAGVGDAHDGVSAVVFDYDDDGDPDIYVANNGQPNVLYRNEGGLRFTDVTAQAKVGQTGGFASVAGDLDNDGDLDLYVSNMNNWRGGAHFEPGEPCYLLINEGDGTFTEQAVAAGVAYVGGPMGLNLGDLDADGWLDLYLGNGGPEPHRWEPDILYRNLGRDPKTGALRFANVTRAAGIWNPRMGHGLTMADFDGDGDLDIYVPNGAHADSDLTRNLFWRNEGHGHHWLNLLLRGTASNRDAIGARATLFAADLEHAEEVNGGMGFGGEGSLELEFGLGDRAAVDRVEIRWPSGARQVLHAPPVDRRLLVTEGRAGWAAR